MPGQPDRLNGEAPRICIVCNQQKKTSEFYLKSKAGSQRYRKCKTCYTEYIREYRKNNKEQYRATQRKWWNKDPQANTTRHKERKYGLEKGEYQELFDRQDGRCGICKEPLIGSGHIDHDHNTQKVRGILCKNCNTGLGAFKDVPERLQNAIKYLGDATVGSHEN
jgi:hypothetical protein